jgi:hypothetical protein
MPDLTNEICAERREKTKTQNRAAVKKYYENPENKKKKLEAQRRRRAEQKAKCNELMNTNDDDNDVPPPPPDYYEPEDEPEAVVNEPQEDVIIPNASTQFTEQEIIELIKNDKGITKKTRETYVVDIKRVFTTTGCSNMKACLTSYKKMITSIVNGKNPKTQQAYSINSIKQTLQSVLFVGTKYMDNFELLFKKPKASQIKKYITTQFEKYKELSKNQNTERQSTKEYPTFNDYLSKVIEKYGESSKEYLISYLYSHFTVRDNFKNMLIIDNIKDNNGKDNFLLISRNKIMFIVNDFKTKKKYERLQFTVTDTKLKKLVKAYVNNPVNVKNREKFGNNYLFGKSSLSPFVSKLNKSIGYDDLGGINVFRHMRISDSNPNISFEERKKLSDSMGHSITVQSQYRRNLKVSE